MNLYTDDNPHTTVKGLGFKNKDIALKTIKIVENYFNSLEKKQKIPGNTPENLLPKKFLKNKEECKRYYNNQKLFRILGMSNRAKGMLKRIKNKKDLEEAIEIFKKWINNLKKK